MKPRILIVDDEPAARHGLKRALNPLDCKIVEAEDGVAALAAIEQSDPDLVICDLQMPKMDGIELLKVLGERPNIPPVIMITAHGSERIAVEAMKTGAYDYLGKPYEVVEHVDEFQTLLGGTEGARREASNRIRVSCP